LLQDIIADTPAALAAEATGGPVAAITVMATTLGTQLNPQGKALAQTTLTGIASAVVASAQAAAAPAASSVSGASA
jgi:hypothetical protein